VGPDHLYSLSGLVPSNITYLCVADVIIPKKKLKALPKALAQFANLEILLLRGLGLSTLASCKFPNLRFLDLSHNAFSKVANIVNCIKHSPNLDMLNILYNPCAYREDVIGRMLAVCLYLVRHFSSIIYYPLRTICVLIICNYVELIYVKGSSK
jgi:hypothetical protein